MKKLLLLLVPFFLFICEAVASSTRNMRIIQDTEIESVIQELVEPLVRAADIPAGRVRVHVVSNSDFNAFVMAGEDIYVHTGLLAAVETPLAFQGIIAHELGHIVGGHIAQMSARMRAETMRSMIIQVLGVGMMVAGGDAGAGMGVVAGGQGVARAGMLAFNREEERQADNTAIDLMVKAGLDPNGLVTALEHMNDVMGAAEARINPYRVAHPLTAERLRNARERISQLEPANQPPPNPEHIARWNLMRAKTIGYLSSTEHVVAVYPISDTSDAAIYARSIAAMRMGRLADARGETQTLIARRPTNPFFYELLGDIEYRLGDYDNSVRAYERSLELRRDSPLIQTSLALVLTERRDPGDADRAVEMAKRALIASPTPLAYWVLARAENLRGNKGIADWAMAEFHNMTRDQAKAREFATRARANLPEDSPEYIKAGELL
jgi:predicted Zn-dependent protease